MLSNHYLGGTSPGPALPGGREAIVSRSSRFEQSWLDASFAAFDQKYGNFDNYVGRDWVSPTQISRRCRKTSQLRSCRNNRTALGSRIRGPFWM
ncbi:hypothetical protein [Rhodococcus sp. ARC_M6]|uniref:hypothetical protein n=1 Tax=Rhodococcus sp. ARC_M6 TaxID=2928852 RepID=UPI001FB26A47|nr:hypothetical protein [Rhodococcus sp. ARC_M6]MCJ0902653.1 hypothetical protein [Rhodococcus sp. ARC_M6]